MQLSLTHLASPLGALTAALNGERLAAFAFAEHWPRVERALARHGAVLAPEPVEAEPLQRRLDAYFAGDLGALDDLPIAPRGTPFQLAVWTRLRAVPPGATISYGELARRIGRPAAVRAVGAANGANPIWLVIPCHRAVGADGSLTGYAGGIERKRWLLAHERGERGRGRM